MLRPETLTEITESEEGAARKPRGWTRHLVRFLAISWALFQLATASFIILDSLIIRSIHLCFALMLVYLNSPFSKKKSGPKFLWKRDHIPLLDVLLCLLAGISALYIVLDYTGIAARAGLPSTRDIITGVILVILLLEATRRIIGPALTSVAVLFIIYCFAAPYMPAFIAAKGVSLSRLMGQVTLSSEGIYGIPLDVSARVVFLFVLFGAMLNRAGGGRYFIQLALSLVGKYKGGPAKAAVIGSGLTGMISGSSIANIVTTGTFTIPLMKKVGYPPTKAAAIEVAASTDGQLAPPIMGAAAFIIAVYVNVPYIEVIKAAFIPAFVSYATLFFITHLEASKLGLRGIRKEDLPQFFRIFKRGIHFLIPVFFLIYQLVWLRHTPESAAFSAVIALAVIMLLQHPFKAWRKGLPLNPAIKQGWNDLASSFVDGSKNMISVALATAAAGIIVAVVSLGLGGLITQIVEALSMGNIMLMLVITALASLLIGMGLPTTATYIVMASLTAPAMVTLGSLHGFMIPLMAAHLFCFYFGILADDTPPVGLAAYAAAAIAKSPPIPTGVQGFLYDIRTAIIAFMFIFNTDLILHNIDSWPLAVYIFITACLGNFCFASATQGWFFRKNTLYDVPLLLLVMTLFMLPNRIAPLLGLRENFRYLVHVPAFLLLSFIILIQHLRDHSRTRSGQLKKHIDTSTYFKETD